MFKVGDIVEAWGVRGVVTGYVNQPEYIEVKFDNAQAYVTTFFVDGKYMAWHEEPSLKLVKRPKAKVKKVLYQAIVKDEGSHSGHRLTWNLYKDLEHAQKVSGACVVGLGPAIEIEVDDE